MLKKGITDYLEEKFTKNTILLHLDGNEVIADTNLGINEHFTEILREKKYNLANNDNNKIQTMSYLANKYLPNLIYQGSNQNIKTDQQESPIKIDSKDVVFDSEKDNFLKDGMKMSEDFKERISFPKFFANQQNERQISEQTVKEITPEHFLNEPTVYKNDKGRHYYSLGSGMFNVTGWSINGFQLRGIKIKFEIFINREILIKEIQNLQIYLNNLLNIMSKSSASKRYFNRKFVLDISLDKSAPSSLVSELENERNSQKSEAQKLDNFLTLAYINPAKEISKTNFTPEILNRLSFDFEINVSEEKDPSDSSNKFNEKLEIYFVFNSSFKIKLSDEFLCYSLDPQIKGEAKDLSNLEQPSWIVVCEKSRDVSSFKDGLVAALKTGDFANLTIDDVDIKKPDGSDLENEDIKWPEGSVAIKIKAKPNNSNFYGETKTFTIWHKMYPRGISLTDLNEPLPIATPDNDASSFRTALITALKTGKFNGLRYVNITKPDGERLDNDYIGTNDLVTVKISPVNGFLRFKDEKILQIQRGSKLKTKFRIS